MDPKDRSKRRRDRVGSGMVGTLTEAPGSLFSIHGRPCLYTGSGPRPACVYVISRS